MAHCPRPDVERLRHRLNTVVIAIAAFIALWKYKVDIMKVIGVCALFGLALSFVR